MPRITRRQFIWTGVAATGGLAVGFGLRPALRFKHRLEAAPAMGDPGWIEVTPDNVVVVRSTLTEMGQGAWLGLAQIVAEEMDAAWPGVRVEMAPSWRAYDAPIGFFTGGSTSAQRLFRHMRTIAATARQMLIEAAAELWQVPAGECQARNSVVIHPGSGQRYAFGAVAAAAATRTRPHTVPLKPRAQWRVLGQALPNPDCASLVDGSTRYGMDLQLPGMLIATVSLAPLPGAKLTHFDRTAAAAVAGVVRVVDIPEGIAVVAGNHWAALQGLARGAPHWQLPALSSDKLRTQMLQAVGGERNSAPDQTGGEVVATFDAPLLLHAQMEPLNATVHVHTLGADVWVPTQNQGAMQSDVASALGLWSHSVTVHTPRVGGGFGRRLNTDYGVVAAQVAKQFDVPVKVFWTREEDSLQGRFRPFAAAQMRAELGAGGAIRQWQVHVAAPGKRPRLGGLAKPPYAVGAESTRYTAIEAPLRTGPWRSVDASQNVFFRECFIDECAAAAGRDPLQYRIDLLAHEPRAQRVLAALAQQCNWSAAAAAGRALGVAFHDGCTSLAAHAVELAAVDAGRWRVARVYAVVDCGTVLNPASVRAQMEGGILFALSAALREEITYDDGRQQQVNFDRYRLLRMADAPPVEVTVLESPQAPLGGIGEVGVPPLAPALANALHAAARVRVRSLPLGRSGLLAI